MPEHTLDTMLIIVESAISTTRLDDIRRAVVQLTMEDRANRERAADSSLPAHGSFDNHRISPAEGIGPTNVHATTLWTFDSVVLRCQVTLPECLIGNISHEDHRAVFDRRRRQFQQQAGLGLPVSFAGMPEAVVTHLMEAFWQHMKEETPQELNTL